MGKQKISLLLRSSKGQSSVEYILMLSVVAFLGFAVIKSDRFKKFFGKDSEFFSVIATQIQYSYRHGRMGTRAQMEADNFDYSGKHDTYKFNDEEKSRFFIQLGKYPSE